MEDNYLSYAVRLKMCTLLVDALHALQHGQDIAETADTLIDQMQLAKAALEEVKDIGEVEAEEPADLPWE